MAHPIRGLLVGPLVVPLGYWIAAMVYAWISNFQVNWFQALRELLTISVFGLPIAYAAALLWGAPVLYVLHRLGWLRAAPVVVTGALGGTIVALGFAWMQQNAVMRVHLPVSGGAALGALAGALCWWAGRARSGKTG
jgi:hypothetical protein